MSSRDGDACASRMSSSDDDFLYDEDSNDDNQEAAGVADDHEDDEDDDDVDDDDEAQEDEDEDEDEDDGIGMDIGEPGPSGSCDQTRDEEEEYCYEILEPKQIMEHMVDSIKDVNNVIQLPATSVRILLNHFKWDKEKLMEKFFAEQEEQEERVLEGISWVAPFKRSSSGSGGPSPASAYSVYSAAAAGGGGGEDGGASARPPSSSSSGKPSSSSGGGKKSVTADCDICLMTMHASMKTGLECGHQYCTACWGEYLTRKIMHEGESQSIECPGSGCGVLVDDQTVFRFIKEPRVRLKYQHLITNSFVECNRLMRWCSAPDCNYAARVRTVEAKPVKCKCGHVFCFKCSENWHDPVRCHLIRKWIKKCDDDSETSNWISANTKECPKCQATIEKDGGCNHMICKNQACKADFCWVCLGPWEPHGSSWYNCNRFDEEEARNARTNQEKSRAALQRYLFYCNRYMNHLQSLKFENKLYAMVKDKMEEMQQHNMSWIEVQFLRKAVDILCECRRTLMNTYVFAYYLKKNNQSELFEANQKDLETSTEMLSEYLERDISAENMADIKQKVQDKYRYCDSRRKVLLDHVHEGYEKDWWQYTETDAK